MRVIEVAQKTGKSERRLPESSRGMLVPWKERLKVPVTLRIALFACSWRRLASWELCRVARLAVVDAELALWKFAALQTPVNVLEVSQFKARAIMDKLMRSTDSKSITSFFRSEKSISYLDGRSQYHNYEVTAKLQR